MDRGGSLNRDHISRDRLAEEKDRACIDLDAAIEALRSDIEKVAAFLRRNSRIIDEAIEAPPPFEDTPDHRGVIFELGHIARDEDALCIGCCGFHGQLPGQAGRFFIVQVVQGEIESGAGECDGARSADSSHGSGHQCHGLPSLSSKLSDLRVVVHSCYNQLVG